MNVYELHRQSTDEKLRLLRTERYAMQSVARKALADERVSMCLRKINGNYVEVWKHLKTSKAFYNGLLVCGSVWHCPVCAAKISERRRLEIKQAFEIHQEEGGKIAMLTLTFSHKKRDSLADIMKKFGQATIKFFGARRFTKIRDFMDIIGRIRVYEVTYGSNGFHPHAHVAIFYKNDVNLKIIESDLLSHWVDQLAKVGLTCNRRGLKLQSGEDAESYMSKYGSWSLEQELSKSHIKKAKKDSLTPFDFLRKYLEDENNKYLDLFLEYAKCFKGRRQIQWSSGLKKRFILEEKTDEEIAKEKIEDADVLGRLNYSEWRQILKSENRALFLDYVEKYGFDLARKIFIKKESSGHEDSQPDC